MYRKGKKLFNILKKVNIFKQLKLKFKSIIFIQYIKSNKIKISALRNENEHNREANINYFLYK